MNAAPRKDRIWLISAILSAVLILMPVAALFLMALESSGGNWSHLFSTVLPRALQTTALLLLGVGILTGVTGVITAWLVTMCHFPGRRLFDWALLIPLAVPTYIIAFAYVDVMAYSGPVQSTVRAIFGFRTARDYWFPEIRSLGGAIFVMSAVLYP
ncbi:MAG: ABC transporter permease, partial [Pannonibacter indicus]